jgi:hypothetical protein
MLLLPEGQAGEPGNISKSDALSEIVEHWTRKVLSPFLVFKGLMDNAKSVNVRVKQREAAKVQRSY